MANVTGPSGKLFSDIDARLREPRKKAPTRKMGVTIKTTAHERYLLKDSSELNCNDVPFIIREVWPPKWPANPERFGAKQRGLAKLLIDEQGGLTAKKVIVHTITDWRGIQTRHGLHGFPTIGVIYGWRMTLLAEAVEGVKFNSRATAEYSGELEDVVLDENGMDVRFKGIKIKF